MKRKELHRKAATEGIKQGRSAKEARAICDAELERFFALGLLWDGLTEDEQRTVTKFAAFLAKGQS